MKNFLRNLTGEYSATAKVVDGSLILSLPDAISPVVWRMELGPVKSAALEVRDQADGTHVLTLKTPRNDVHDIAPFASRGQAVRALMAVSRALENSHGQVLPAPIANQNVHHHEAAPTYIHKPRKNRWVAIVAVLILLVIGVILVAQQTPRTTSFSAVPASDSLAANNSSNETAGVPMSADSYLQQDKPTAPTTSP